MTVFTANTQANAFYTKLGYEELPEDLMSPRAIQPASLLDNNRSPFVFRRNSNQEDDSDSDASSSCFANFGMRLRSGKVKTSSKPVYVDVALFKPLNPI